jgi:hypothetical protein
LLDGCHFDRVLVACPLAEDVERGWCFSTGVLRDGEVIGTCAVVVAGEVVWVGLLMHRGEQRSVEVRRVRSKRGLLLLL